MGSRMLGPLLFLGCTLSSFLFSLEDLHCLFEACYLSSGFFSVCIVLMILVVWYSLSWLIHRGFGLDFISFLFFSFVGGLRGAEPSSLLWGHSFFCFGSLLQRRRTLSDFVGLTSPQGGKGSYITF